MPIVILTVENSADMVWTKLQTVLVLLYMEVDMFAAIHRHHLRHLLLRLLPLPLLGQGLL